jgi:hypothetical protein
MVLGTDESALDAVDLIPQAVCGVEQGRIRIDQLGFEVRWFLPGRDDDSAFDIQYGRLQRSVSNALRS